MSGSELILAVAGSRKTQGIIDACVAAPSGSRILIITYTVNNQIELRRRMLYLYPEAEVEIVGWFTFLLHNILYPYLPFLFPGQQIRGMDNESGYQRGVRTAARERYFTSSGLVRRVHLAHLATQLIKKAKSLPLRRLEVLYDHIFIDEVQDLTGYDLDVLAYLLNCEVPLTMVGDVRQAVLSTNPEERKYPGFKNMQVWHWFLDKEKQGVLTITYRQETWRCHPAIALFADSLFAPEWGFPATVSRNEERTDHDGIFLVRTEDVDAYVSAFSPQLLRWDSRAMRSHDHLKFLTFGSAKGLTRSRVLIVPTVKMRELLQKGVPLGDLTAAKLYVGVTRAEQSVAFVLDHPGGSTHPYWFPTGNAG